MKNKILNYFSKLELAIWLISIVLITSSFLIFDRTNYLTLIASLIGATSLIFCAKGNPFGQILMIIFSIIYGLISYFFTYYGEMITYIGMTMPMAVLSFFSWIKNPSRRNKSEVKVNQIMFKEWFLILFLTTIVTLSFYFILSYFNTKNLVLSTLSVATSFIAVYLTFRRSPLYAVAYALNDIILIVLWSYASSISIEYIPVVICFIVFLANDLYSYINWKKLFKLQNQITID